MNRDIEKIGGKRRRSVGVILGAWAMAALLTVPGRLWGQPVVTHVAPTPAPFRVLVLAEGGGQHGPFVEAARRWLRDCGRKEGFECDEYRDTGEFDAALLARYRVFLQLDYPPYRWTPTAQATFRDYIEKGQGGWVGLHHASLLGEFDGYPLWPWFHDFMGRIRFRNYIPQFAAGTVRVEDRAHPCVKDMPKAFVIPKEEWYTYDRSPRPRVRVLASVDESTYAPDTPTRMGDHPVVWTNEKVAARNVYIFMGHGPDLLDNPAYTALLRNSILWAAGR